jgi:hypothetical protein
VVATAVDVARVMAEQPVDVVGVSDGVEVVDVDELDDEEGEER